MKKLAFIGLLAALCVLFVLPVPVFAATVTGTFTGPSTVRAGDSITLTYQIKGEDIKAFSASLEYDSTQVTLSKITKSIADPWSLTTNGDALMLADEQLSKPINKATKLFTVTFKVKSSLKVGTKINISVVDGMASAGSAQKVAKVTYSATIAAPKSTNNKLKSLSVTGGELAPTFGADITEYAVTVPFSIDKLEVKAAAADSKAKVSVDSPSLVVGENTVTVTVTAESGAKQTYTIKVTREQDPNYVPADNALLSGITVEGYVISPFFDPAVTEYIVWLPYETERISVSGTPADSKAKVEVRGGDVLLVGADTPVRLICTAENGSTTLVYTVLARRAAPHGSEETPDEPDTPVVGPGPEDPPAGDTPPAGDDPGNGDANTPPDMLPALPDSFSLPWVAGIGAGTLGLGLLLGLALGRRTKKGRH